MDTLRKTINENIKLQVIMFWHKVLINGNWKNKIKHLTNHNDKTRKSYLLESSNFPQFIRNVYNLSIYEYI